MDTSSSQTVLKTADGEAPETVEAQLALAREHLQAERAVEAEAAARRSLVLDPERSEAALLLARALMRLERFDEARAWFAVVLARNPSDGSALIALGVLWRRMGRPEEALDCFRRVTTAEPNRAQGHVGEGASLADQGRLEEAEAAFRRAIALESGHAEARANLGLVLLAQGRYAEGWAENAWRWRLAGNRDVVFPGPRWVPDGHARDVVLLHAEQGLGDTIQFLRYVPEVAALDGPVILRIQNSLVSLVRAAGLGADSIWPRNVSLPPYRCQSSLMQLMEAFGTTQDTIPWNGPYLAADPEEAKRWRERRGGDSRPAIGVIWRGNPAHGNDQNRSLSPDFLAPLLARRDLRLVGLQKQPRAGDVERLAELGAMEHWGPDLADFRDTAAAMAALDLIVSVDSAPAHLAGALGRPTVLLLPRVPDWRWGQAGETTPWYPTMTLMRQERAGDWPMVIARLTQRLAGGDLFSRR